MAKHILFECENFRVVIHETFMDDVACFGPLSIRNDKGTKILTLEFERVDGRDCLGKDNWVKAEGFNSSGIMIGNKDLLTWEELAGMSCKINAAIEVFNAEQVLPGKRSAKSKEGKLIFE